MSEIIQTGRVYASAPRAVQVREPEHQEVHHSAIHGAVDILVDSQKERTAILNNWQRIAEAINKEAQAIIHESNVIDEESSM